MKIDLHTHCREATACPKPDLEIVKKIVNAVKENGLDGIAVTEHYTNVYGRKVKEIVDNQLNSEIVIIPGQELDKMFTGKVRGIYHQVELLLPDDLTFRFIAHPGHPYIKDIETIIDDSIHGIEIKNPNHLDDMDEEQIRYVSEKYNLILLTNSDAHRLRDIGTYYNEIEIEELCNRVRAASVQCAHLKSASR